MIIQSSRLGEVEISEETVIDIVDGLPGFEEYSRYVLMQTEEIKPFYFFQSVERGDLSFVIVDPFEFFKQYEFEISEEYKVQLEIRDRDEVCVFTIVTVNSVLKDATANLLAPLVINASNKKGKQIILHDSAYKVKHRMFTEDEAG